jgi:Protein of unknown function (DUF2934)
LSLKEEKAMVSARRTPVDPSQNETPPTASPAVQDQIRQRAYEIYEQRGRQDGLADEDWLQAEAEILDTNVSFKAAA